MKSAREHAESLANAFGWSPSNRSWRALVEAAEPLFKEHARDQRHVVAELELANDAVPVTREDAHRIAVNAPAPGEQR